MNHRTSQSDALVVASSPGEGAEASTEQPLAAGTPDGGAELGSSGNGLGFTSEVDGTPPGTRDEADEESMAQSARETAEREADAVEERN